MEPVLGIIGGMGPLASAEFMATLYEFNLSGVEQEAPRCVLYSDPTVPDRTQAIANGNDTEVTHFLSRAAASLCEAGAERLIVTCMTAHHFVERLPEDVRARTISLVDVLMDAISASQSKLLLLATTGTRRSGLLAAHPRWSEVRERIVLPTAQDQNAIHDLIYTRLKSGGADSSLLETFREMTRAYGASGCLAACTDLHLLTRLWLRNPQAHENFEFCDPLLHFAQRYRRYMHVES
ncbi:MAG TPA: amino acid racemase [Planctomycetota bacterium]|nr:amino acid racemase [Planctomycetota bacterium]